MSAFYVGEDHINAMLTAAKALKMYVSIPGHDYWTDASYQPVDIWDRIGRALIAENFNSLDARYPSPSEDHSEEIGAYRFVEDTHFLTRHKLTDAIHLVRCYDYQSCEHDGWEGSWAHEFCQRLMAAAAATIPESGRCWSYVKPADASNIIRLKA